MEQHDQRQSQLFVIMPLKIEQEAGGFELRVQDERNKGRKKCAWSAEYKANYGSLVDRQTQFVLVSNTRRCTAPLHIFTSPHLRSYASAQTRIR